MAIYWIDSNVFIEAQANLYPFKNFPGFWKHLDQMLADEMIFSSQMVYQELVGYADDLAKWIRARKQNGLCVSLSEKVETNFQKIADYVHSQYDGPNASEFLRGADGWLIAHAMSTKGVVVSQESQKHPNAHKARIPDVCHHFKVRCIKLIDMLKEQNATI